MCSGKEDPGRIQEGSPPTWGRGRPLPPLHFYFLMCEMNVGATLDLEGSSQSVFHGIVVTQDSL